MIVHTVSEIDQVLDIAITGMAGGKFAVLPLLTYLGNKDKRDYILAMFDATMPPSASKKDAQKLMKRTGSAASLRNDVTHCAWIKGRKEGSIKPTKIQARQVLKVLGIEHNEKEWTAAELQAEAEKFHSLGVEVASFFRKHGFLPVIERNNISTNSLIAASVKG